MENEDKLVIGLNGEDFEINRRNTSLFTFIGRNAIKNHVFLVLEDNPDGTVEGTHIWEEFMEMAYIALENHIIRHDYPQHLNLNDVSQIDEDAFERAVSAQFRDLSDYVPEDFKLSTEGEDGRTAE
jgi:hypothetical protein